jgi:UDPglucose--hexose-1-phosphate uridylyltransferase
MPELRYSVINREWVIIATERAKRPEDFSSKPAVTSKDASANCPFCPGKETSTPKEVFAIRDQNTAPDTGGWKVRVIPNAFPALSSAGEPTREKDKTGFQSMNGVGIHEVIIESPDHEQIIATMDPAHVEDIFTAYKQRYETLSKDPRFESIILFKNH